MPRLATPGMGAEFEKEMRDYANNPGFHGGQTQAQKEVDQNYKRMYGGFTGPGSQYDEHSVEEVDVRNSASHQAKIIKQ